MATYMIGYDLNKPQQNYGELIGAIKKYTTWWHHLDSTWIIITEKTAVQVRDDLSYHLDENDELLIAEISSPAAWKGFDQSGSQWLKDHL